MNLILVVEVLAQLPKSPSSLEEAEDILIASQNEIDPYFDALKYYQGDNMKEYDRLKEILERLSPRNYLDDWGKLGFHKAFDDPDDSSD